MKRLMVWTLYISQLCLAEVFFFFKTTEFMYLVFSNRNPFRISVHKSRISKTRYSNPNLTDLKYDSSMNNNCEEAIILKNTLVYEDEKRNESCKITYEIDSLSVRINIRFEDFPKLDFIEIICETYLKAFISIFPNQSSSSYYSSALSYICSTSLTQWIGYNLCEW